MTSVAVLQGVEKGQLSLEDDVSTTIHELKDMDILIGIDRDGTPRLKKASRKITLRWATQCIQKCSR